MKNQTKTDVTWLSGHDGLERRPRSIAFTASFATQDSVSRTCSV